MIELILTNTLDSAPILEKLKNSRSQAKKHLLFVPDRFSLSYQKAVLEYLNIKGTFDIEVTSFPRLANQLLKGKSRLLDKQSEIMLLRKVIEDNKKDLKRFANFGKNADFANDIYAAISQIRNSNVSVEKMAEAIDFLPKRIADKTKDIVTIYKGYVEFLQDGYADGTSKLQALAELINDGALGDCNIYISDFMSFSAVEYDIVKALMLNSLNTYISLLYSDCDNSQIFPYEVKDRLLSLAEESGVGVNISHANQVLTGDALTVYKGLYSYKKMQGERDGKIQAFACSDIAQEVKSVAREINRLVRNSGVRYKDVAIVCCDFASYSPYIKSVFDNFGIPFYADIKQPLSAQSVCKALCGAIRAVKEDFARAEVIEYAKLPFVTENYKDACVFENYCLKYNVEYTRFLSPFTLGDEKTRDIAEKVRQRVAHTLSHFNLKEGKGRDFVNISKKFLEVCQASAQTEKLAGRQSEQGYGELSSITLQSLNKLNLLLDRCDAMLGESFMDMEEYYGILTAAIESVDMSNIPLYLDSVFIGETSESRYENIDYMYIIGASAGKFPAEHSDTGIVSEREYTAWGKLGIDVQPDCRRRNGRERLNTLMMMTRARKGLRISYSSSGAGGEQNQPGAALKYLCDLLNMPLQTTKYPNREWSEQDYAVYVSAKGNALQELIYINSLIKNGGLENNSVALEAEDILYAIACKDKGKEYVDFLLEGLKEETSICGANEVMFNGNRTSVSQFEKYFKCPFLHFNENVLKLKTREISGLEVKDTGILLHATLEKYFRLTDCADKSEEEIQIIAPQLFMQAVEENPDYRVMFSDSANTLTLKQLIAQATYAIKNLVKNMSVTKFRPSMLEASFGSKYPYAHNLKGMQIYNGYRTLNFEGVIDRIDRYKDRVIVIDYKSKYNIDFTPSNILYGDRIQLFVYLNALKQNGDITTQGAFYLLMNNRFVKSGDKSGKRFMHRGFVNCEEEFIADLDGGFADGGAFESDVYPVKRKVDRQGEVIYAGQERGEILDTRGFDEVCDYVMRLTSKSAKEIEEGYIAKSPLNIGGDEVVKACRYCNYANVCKRGKILPRDVKKVDMEEFSNIAGGKQCQQ